MAREKNLIKIGVLILTIASLFSCYAHAGNAEKDFLGKGMDYGRQGNNDAAIAEFNKAITINPASADAYHNRGLAYANMGDFDSAISDFNKATQLKPDLAKAYSDRALAYFYKKDYEKSWTDVHKVESLRYKMGPKFMSKLISASGRQK